MPTFADLVSALQQSKPFKACGPDLIPPALCHSHARDLAKLLWPLLLKTVTQGSEPVGFKGGRLLHIPKPNAHDRSSTVSPAVAFSCSRHLAALPVAHMERAAPALQRWAAAKA